MKKIELSSLAHTWLIDIDGTIVKHNAHLEGVDELLPGVLEFWKNLPEQDTIILLSARSVNDRERTLTYFSSQGLRFDQALFGLPTGERILINDLKPRGLVTSIAINVERNFGLANTRIEINSNL